MKLIIHLLSFTIVFCVCQAGLPLDWHSYLVVLIQQHRECPFAPIIIPAPVPPVSLLPGNACPTSSTTGANSGAPEPTGPAILPTSATVMHTGPVPSPKTGAGPPIEHYFLPDVLLWDPFQQYPLLFKEVFMCPEDGCGLPMKFLTWQDGSKARYNPRTLYGVNGIVLLVGQIFRCSSGHLVTTYDPRRLSVFPDRSCLPFMLLHKCGLTVELVDFIFVLASQGTSFKDIHQAIKGNCQARYHRSQIAYWCTTYGSGVSPGPALPITFPEFGQQTVSNDIMMNSFVVKAKELENFFATTMSSLMGTHLSCDHTFKLAKHIGIMRDGSWVSQYDTLFILINDKGEVLYWQLTKGTAFSTVQDGLKSLNDRIIGHKKLVEIILIDNCCTWRKKLVEMFGEQTQIKLDLFHAVKRVSSAASKKHPAFHPFLNDFRLVFRSLGDSGLCRTKSTPPPHVLLSNLESFLKKWTNISQQMPTPILTQAVQKQINQLRQHMEKGCLSCIPPGLGTNKNENLHRCINKRLAGQRLGVDLAVALLSTFFHLWNIKRSDKDNISPVAEFYKSLSQFFKACVDSGQGLSRPSCDEKISYGIATSHQRHLSEEQLGTAFLGKSNATQTIWQIHEIRNELNEEDMLLREVVEITLGDIVDIVHSAVSCLRLEQCVNELSKLILQLEGYFLSALIRPDFWIVHSIQMRTT